MSDENVEAQPLWEYPGKAVSEPVLLARVALFDEPHGASTHQGSFNISQKYYFFEFNVSLVLYSML